MTMWQKIFVVAVIALGTILRLHTYDIYPQRGATSDEYTYAFLGQSLLTRGMPISWSYFGGYKNHENLTIDKLYFPIVWPYFDHPPLNGLVVASFAIARGETTFEQIELSTIRLVPIALTVVSSVLLFLLLLRHYEFSVAIGALIIYQTATIMVVSSRVVMAENLLTPLFLGALYFYDVVRKRLNGRAAAILALVAACALWTKELGIVVGMTVISLCIADKQKFSRIFIIAAILAASVASYFAYGFYYDKEVFLAIITTQATRMIGPETLWMLMSRPVLINKLFYDGWYIFGLLALFVCFLDWNKHSRLVLPFFIYFILLLGSLTREGEMGWYMIPVYPFMAGASAMVLHHAWNKPHPMVLVAILIVGMSLFHYLIEVPFGITLMRFRIFLGVILFPLLIAYLARKDVLAVRIQRTMIVAVLISTTLLTYSYTHPA